MAKFDDTRPFAPPAHIQFRKAKKERPEFIREATAATLYLPLIAGALAFVGVGLIVLAFGWPVKVALAVSGAAVLAAGVYWSLANLQIMYTTEKIDGVDPPPMLQVEPPQPTTPFLYRKGPGQIEAGDWGITPELFTEWCRAGYGEQSLAFGKWVCRFGLTYPKQGRTKFEAFRALWIARGYGVDIGGNKGLQFTEEGMDHAAGWLFSHGKLQQVDSTPPPAALGTGEPE